MGLFDFLKSNNERKYDEMAQEAQELKQKIFPEGSSQMIREVKEVREFLDFKYTLEDTERTYLHAATVYFVSKDKSQDAIVKGILSHSESVVTKSDAISIYCYLKAKSDPKSALEEVKQTVAEWDDATRLLMVAMSGIVELKQFQELSDAGKFEVILFNSTIILPEYHRKYPDRYRETEEEYFRALVKQAETYGISLELDELVDFINQRFRLYTKEFNKLLDSKTYFPGLIYSGFYEQPLAEEPEISLDATKVVIFMTPLIKMVHWSIQGVKTI